MTNEQLILILATTGGALLATSRVISAAKPFWHAVPQSVQEALPAVTVAASALGGAFTGELSIEAAAVLLASAWALWAPGKFASIPKKAAE